MSDDSNQQYVPLYYEDQVVIIVRGEHALKAMEAMAAVLADALSRPISRGGGGNWGKKGEDRGLYKLPPSLDTFEKGDEYKIVAAGYNVSSSGDKQRVYFTTPFDKEGNLTDGVGVRAASIQIGSATWKRIFKDWEPKTGQPQRLTGLRLITMKIAENDSGTKYAFLVGVAKSDSVDPESFTFAEPPASKEDGSNGK